MTTNVQLLHYILNHRLPPGQLFLGVFSSDNLPIEVGSNSCLIVNYSKRNQPGTHWVAMSGLGTNEPMFFDSYGRKPDTDDIYVKNKTSFDSYLRNHSLSGQYQYNTIDLQSWNVNGPDDDVCGQWCIAFLYHGLPRPSSKFWRPFLNEQSREKRDEMIASLIKIFPSNKKL